MATFRINSIIFSEFYKITLKAIIEKEHSGDIDDYSEESLWDAQLFKEQVFKPCKLRINHFFRTQQEIEGEDCIRFKQNAGAFMRALKYIDPTTFNKDIPTHKLKEEAEIWLQDFLVAYNLTELDRIANESINESNAKIHNFHNKSIKRSVKDNSLDLLNRNQKQAETACLNFFNCINSHEDNRIAQAWNLLTPNFQFAKWPESPSTENAKPQKGDIEKFKKGYKFTKGIFNISVFKTYQDRPDSPLINCQVYYEDTVDIHKIKEFSSADILKVEDVEDFLTNVQSFEKRFKAKELQGIENVELRLFFQKTISEHIRIKCNINDDEMASLFSEPVEEIIKRVSDIRLRQVDGKWLIDNIDDAKIIPIR